MYKGKDEMAANIKVAGAWFQTLGKRLNSSDFSELDAAMLRTFALSIYETGIDGYSGYEPGDKLPESAILASMKNDKAWEIPFEILSNPRHKMTQADAFGILNVVGGFLEAWEERCMGATSHFK